MNTPQNLNGSPLANETIFTDFIQPSSKSSTPLDDMKMDIDTEFKQFPTPELETLVGTIDKEQLQVDALAQITRDTELLPALIELIEDVKSGRISVQEFGNHAGPLRRKISRIKQNLVANIDGLEETNDDRQFQINEFKSGIEKKKQLMARFQETVGKRIDLTKAPEKKLVTNISL